MVTKAKPIREKPSPAKMQAVVRDRIKRAVDDGTLYAPYSYQAERLSSQSRFNLDMWSRQTGKSEIHSLDKTLRACATGHDVMMLSASLDQTKELMLKVARVAEAISGIAGEIQQAVLEGDLEQDFEVDPDGLKITQTIITLPGGERITGRPANPRTARGFSADVFLDEFPMHRDQSEIWAASYGSIVSKPQFRFDVAGTPLLPTDKFMDMWGAALRKEVDFRTQLVTIYDAVKAGHPANPEELRRNLRDEDRWQREFLCIAIDTLGAFLGYDLIRGCAHEAIKLELPPDPADWTESVLGWNPGAGDIFVGVDIGRRKDLTVFWILQQIGDVLWTRGVLRYRNTPFQRQFDIGCTLFSKLQVRRVAVDATGMGMMLAEQWQVFFGTARVEALTYTNALKSALAEGLKPFFDDRRIRVPIESSIQEALHSVQKLVTAAGNIRFAGERTPDGHADEFWALANAVYCVTDSKQVGGLIVL